MPFRYAILPPPTAATVSPAPAAAPWNGEDLPDDDTPVCGWFDSSWALRQGLAVSELPDSDGTVAALWFAGLAADDRSVQLQ